MPTTKSFIIFGTMKYSMLIRFEHKYTYYALRLHKLISKRDFITFLCVFVVFILNFFFFLIFFNLPIQLCQVKIMCVHFMKIFGFYNGFLALIAVCVRGMNMQNWHDSGRIVVCVCICYCYSSLAFIFDFTSAHSYVLHNNYVQI